MNRSRVILFSVLAFAAGIIFLALRHNVIVIRSPFLSNIVYERPSIEKRKVKLFYWYNDAWQHEAIDIMWSSNKAQTVKYLVDAWLALIDEEKLMQKKTSLQSATIGLHENEVFLSFDRNPFSKESPTFEKWMWVEGLLKTLRDNDLKMQNVRFLVHHQELHDQHLNFSNPWPGIGFLVK